MPTVLFINGYRFFFYSNENNEPVHIHIEKADATAKVWLEPLEAEYFIEFSAREQREIMKIINQHAADFIKKWNEYFS